MCAYTQDRVGSHTRAVKLESLYFSYKFLFTYPTTSSHSSNPVWICHSCLYSPLKIENPSGWSVDHVMHNCIASTIPPRISFVYSESFETIMSLKAFIFHGKTQNGRIYIVKRDGILYPWNIMSNIPYFSLNFTRNLCLK